MARLYNFSPGPAMLPASVLTQARDSLLEYGDWQASVLEVSHRDERFLALYDQAQCLLRRLLAIPTDYAVLLLQGGASGQASAIPMNINADKAAYAITGHWSKRFAGEAKKYTRVYIAADNSANGHTALPTQWDIPADAAYVHYVDNETIHGLEFSTPPTSPVPRVVDMTSSLLTKRLDVRDYGLIYAGTQKNLGIAGLAVVIVRRDLIRPRAQTPMIWDYKQQDARQSMVNTPPTFQIYLLGLMLQWVEDAGGIEAMAHLSAKKSACLYRCLDSLPDTYTITVDKNSRSRLNVPFFLADDRRAEAFFTGAKEHGLIGLKGHKIQGGMRASLYNAMPLVGVQSLVAYLGEFASSA